MPTADSWKLLNRLFIHGTLLQVVERSGLNGYLNTGPNKVFGAIGDYVLVKKKRMY